MDTTFITSAFKQAQYPPADRPEVAFAGRSNVGKSSLLNTLVNRRKLARTSSRPGRTQAINFFRLGEQFYLVDLPGYGFARVPLPVKESWRRMVETYLEQRSNLKAVVVIIDVRRGFGQGDLELLQWLDHHGIRAICVLTKADKLSRQKALQQARKLSGPGGTGCDRPILFSAKTRQGREELWAAIRDATAESE